MAKIGRLTGPSNPDGTRPRIVRRTAGVDIEILGADSDLHVAGDVRVTGRLRAGTSHVTVPAEWGDRWATTLAQAKAGETLARIGVLSSSVGQGIFTGQHDTAWPGLTRTNLQASYGDGGTGWLDDSNSTTGAFGGPGGPGGNDTVLSTSPGWTNVTGGVNGGHSRPTSDGSGATITYHPRGSQLDIVQRRDPDFTGGAWTYQIDSEDPVTVSSEGGPDLHTTTVTGLGEGEHTVVVTATAGQCRIAGVRGYNTSGVLVENFSSGGRSLANTESASTILTLAAEGLSGETTMSTTLTTMAPLDLLAVGLGVNDAARATIDMDAMWQALSQLHFAVRTAGRDPDQGPPDIVMLIEHFGSFDDADYDAPQVSALLRAWAQAVGAAVVDVWSAGRHSHQYTSAKGWWVIDGVHPSDAGHREGYFPPLHALLTGG